MFCSLLNRCLGRTQKLSVWKVASLVVGGIIRGDSAKHLKPLL